MTLDTITSAAASIWADVMAAVLPVDVHLFAGSVIGFLFAMLLFFMLVPMTDRPASPQPLVNLTRDARGRFRSLKK